MGTEPATPVISILEAVAAADRTEALDLPPLSAAVDPEALNALLDPSGNASAPKRVTFDYAGRTVTVRRDGGVVVDPPRASAVDRPSDTDAARQAGVRADEPLVE
ncbi:HalOD1 output domain-containing protein [Halosimplex halophilum]|uniref:HalOD1 output domain-containing protein n=1 Tax=Halosimplex halophilum TaxID=2559572 RepID=UPI00107F5315|nr:HalOD1 output domain-containing protein [Halosimplex halophilum]